MSKQESSSARDGEVPFRILPRVTDQNRHFWTGGEQGELRFLCCNVCGKLIHPPVRLCPDDLSTDVEPAAVSGRATIATYTINHQPWMPGPELPYVVAIVEIEEDPSVRLTTNVIDCAPEEVRVGMPVEVVFEKHPDGEDAVWIPLFRPQRTEA